MEIREQNINDAFVLRLSGRLDELATAEVELAFSALVQKDARKVVVDLAGVDYISSSGLRVLLMLWKALEKTHGQLRLCGLVPFVVEVFGISNFDKIFSIHGGVEDALAAL
ncbi:MAG: STAS domain-containing protein [Candidatus Hydrogenedentes bacterium]|nr:STAS domain-containing protein [Candidatus Hydrogenedentota bacterium]MBI3117910.1 STAS domain-containing protein [Candidatus Hydrogenedentota bacterium]